ncbi:M23 family metallopeptidase [Uruburuella testudinis]|uniref:M23 family metallopeptidase n=1 Tax=Uruburuella testudinis TaxID=1282863 RepID=A0ABY4DTV5_9NEIS|nr:M23 family metallopeptidase [Uruburuella testudinis]UOO81042.1 M23 family metallopeptidase [Uruburuella testudinis]
MNPKKLLKHLLWLLVAVTLVIGLQPYWAPYWWRAKLLQEPAPAWQSLPNPLPGQRFSDTWGAARNNGRRHEGVDIFARRGTPILSTTKGVVNRVGRNNLGGNIVGITGPGGVWHYYAHLESFAEIKENDWIEAGTVIGYVGDSGNAKGTPPHLHYGVYTREGAVNPYPLIRQ